MKKLLVLPFLFVLLAPAFMSAQTPTTPTTAPNTFCDSSGCTYTPLEPLPVSGYPQKFGPNGGQSFNQFLNYLFKLFITLGGIIAVGLLVYAGILYMMSEVINKKEEARKRIQAAVWGLLLLISSYLILNTINPELLNFSFFNARLGNTPATTNATPNTDPKATSGTGSASPEQTQNCQNKSTGGPQSCRIDTTSGGWACKCEQN